MAPAFLTRTFVRHYIEMVLVMLAGMGLLTLPARWVTSELFPSVDPDGSGPMLAQMGIAMLVPMVPWMRPRGHAWQPTFEMVLAMAVPVLAVLALLQAGLVESVGLLMTLEHIAMFVAMFAVMAARPEEYSRPHAHAAT